MSFLFKLWISSVLFNNVSWDSLIKINSSFSFLRASNSDFNLSRSLVYSSTLSAISLAVWNLVDTCLFSRSSLLTLVSRSVISFTIFLFSSSRLVICSLLDLSWRFFMESTCLLRFSISVSFSIRYSSEASLSAATFCSSWTDLVWWVRISFSRPAFVSTSLALDFCNCCMVKDNFLFSVSNASIFCESAWNLSSFRSSFSCLSRFSSNSSLWIRLIPSPSCSVKMLVSVWPAKFRIFSISARIDWDSEMLLLDDICNCKFSASNSSMRFLSFSHSSWQLCSSALYLYNSFSMVIMWAPRFWDFSNWSSSMFLVSTRILFSSRYSSIRDFKDSIWLILSL